jgi:hypothetical protein
MSLLDSHVDLDKELAKCGGDPTLLREMARRMMPDWFAKVYGKMMDPEIPTGALLSIGDKLIQVGDLAPKKEAPVAAPGAGFSISINLPGPDGGRTLTLEASRQQADELGDAPAHVSFDYHANDDLTGGVDAGEDVLLLPRDEDS